MLSINLLKQRAENGLLMTYFVPLSVSHMLALLMTWLIQTAGHNMTEFPSKHARSDQHLIQIGSKVLARIGLDDSCTLACFQTGSIWPQNLTVIENQIRSRLVLHSVIWAICERMHPSLKLGNWLQAGCVLPEPDPMILEHWLASCPDAFGPNLTTQIRSGSFLHNMIWAFFRRKELNWIQDYDLAQFWLHTGRNGHKRPLPKCFQIGTSVSYWVIVMFLWLSDVSFGQAKWNQMKNYCVYLKTTFILIWHTIFP